MSNANADDGAAGVRHRRVRDLLILDGLERLVVACDSIGGIGAKPHDTVAADPVTVAHMAVRVPLLEVLCAGARVVAVIDTLGVELDGDGVVMIAEVRRMALEAGVPASAVTGSTEDNVAVTATGLGVTVLGALPAEAPVGAGARRGDIVVCAGLPLSAPRDTLYPGHPGQVAIAEVVTALGSGHVHDAVPVGSKGVAHEAAQLVAPAALELEWLPGPVNRNDSGGPSSCVLLACDPAGVEHLRAVLRTDLPLHEVARLV